MIRYRPFRNSDPPSIAEIWRSQPPLRGRVRSLATTVFERLVLAKPYFDPQGLIVAVEDDRPVGFAHAGFGPTDDGSSLRTDAGVTCLAMTAPHELAAELAAALLQHSEEYVRQKGANVLYAGGFPPLTPFYLGLYGGSHLPGVLASDERAVELYRSAGYEELERRLVFQRKLTGFRPPMDRRHMQLRRGWKVAKTLDPRPSNWWEACLTSHLERVRYDLVSTAGDPPCGGALLWDMEPLATSWGVHARGLIELEIEESRRRQGLATLLLGEVMRELRTRGVAFVEAQIAQTDVAAIGLLQRLGFLEVEQGIVFRKRV